MDTVSARTRLPACTIRLASSTLDPRARTSCAACIIHPTPWTPSALQNLNRWVTARGPAGEVMPKVYVYIGGKGRLMLRPWSDTNSHEGQPSTAAFRVLMWLCWGPPPRPGLVACHVACDHHRCMNPLHGRWGTQADNLREHSLLSAYYNAIRRMPDACRGRFASACHPARNLLVEQGFW